MSLESLFWLVSLIALMPISALAIGLLFAVAFRQPQPRSYSFPPTEPPTDPDAFNIRTQKVSVQTITEAERRIAAKRQGGEP